MSLSLFERITRLIYPDRDHNQKWKFFIRLLSEVPENSYWSIQGLDDVGSQAILSSFFVKECGCGDWTWGSYHIRLTKEVRTQIISLLTRNDMLYDLTHQAFCRDGKAFFVSYDHLATNLYNEDFMSDELKRFCRDNGISLSVHTSGDL